MTANRQRVVVVTGASSGIGKAAAQTLAAKSFRVIGLGRNPERSAQAALDIGAAAGGGPVDMVLADLSRMAEAARAAREIAGLTDHIDVLINNAGGMTRAKVITEEGLEENFASNHLGPFLLTNRLLPLLRRTAAVTPAGSVRILNTSSDASEMIPGIDFDDLQGLERFDPGNAYCRGKLANVLFARGLARRLAADGIVAHAMCPGFVESNFITYADEQLQAHMRSLKGKTPEEGADTLVWLATAEEPGRSSGGYFHERAPRTPHPSAEDDACVDRLWAESERLVASTGA